MAIACFLLLTLRPLPLLSLPRLYLCSSRFTSLEALLEYFRAMLCLHCSPRTIDRHREQRHHVELVPAMKTSGMS
jgi:hypothetical protein